MSAETKGKVRAAFTLANGWDAKDRACLHGALAHLAAKAGDAEGTATECRRAQEIAPTWIDGPVTERWVADLRD
jgi:hypothetical protein